jgi:hypothetical protein
METTNMSTQHAGRQRCRLFWFWIFIVLEQPKFQNSRALSAKRESAKVLITIKKDVLQALPFPVRRAPRKKRSSGPAVLRQIPPPEKVRRSPKRGCLGLWAPGAT